jgi:hypothetical protein
MSKLYKSHNSKRALGEIVDRCFTPNKTGIKYLDKANESFSIGYNLPLYKKGVISKIKLTSTQSHSPD